MNPLTIYTACLSDKGLNPKYLVNEDSYLIMEEERIFAVAVSAERRMGTWPAALL